MWSEIGLVLIAIAWLIQMIFSFSKKEGIVPSFILCYMAGVVILVFDGFVSGATWMAVLNLVTFVFAFLVLIAVSKKK